MKTLLEKFCNSNERNNGLLLIDMPTGVGKTYSVAEYIAGNYQNIKGKIFFVTQLKKNLPEDDLRKCFRKINKEAELDSLMIRVESNVDCLCKNFDSVKTELNQYIGDTQLLRKIEREIKILARKDLSDEDLFLLQQARDDLQEESERSLRYKISDYLKYDSAHNERKKQDKIQLLKNDPAYSWIGKLYPTVYSNEKKIFIMSLDKFLLRYSTIIEPPFFIPDSPLITDGVVFIDEFDSSKEVILNRIIENGLTNHLGIIELFRVIYARLSSQTAFTKILTQESVSIKEKIKVNPKIKTPEQIINGFRERADEIVNRYNLKFLHKLKEESRESVSFLFHDYKVHTIVNGQNKKISVEEDDDVRINWLKIDGVIQEADQNDSIYALVTDLNSFLKYFQNGIGFIADNYIALKRERKKDIYNISYESAIRTVLSEFGIEHRNQDYVTSNVMLSAKRRSFDWQHMEDYLDFTVYEKGFRYYDLVDNEYYDTQSRIKYFAFNDSPEKFIIRLINRTKVVGISATATLPSVLVNYDVEYLKKRCADLIVIPTEADKARLKKSFQHHIAKYDNVRIICEAFGQEEGLSEVAKKVYNDCAAKIEQGYKRQRFLCFCQSVDQFFQHDDIKSFLYFANNQGRDYQIEGENLFFSFFKEIRMRLSKPAKIFFLNGSIEVFERRKQDMLEALKNGEKVFAVTTYGSMGAGQNIQYKFSEDCCSDLVQINEFTFNTEEKDFDAIYLELPANIVVNIARGFDSDVTFVKYIYQMKFLQETGDLGAWEVEQRIRNAFRSRFGNYNCRDKHPRKSESYSLAYAKVILQAIGRICRTPNKNKNIYVYYQSELAERVKPIVSYFEHRMINPEFRSFLASCAATDGEAALSDNIEILKTKAENNIVQSRQIIDNLRENWTINNVRNWEEIREFVLKHPTLPSIDNVKFADLYFELPQSDNKFYIKTNTYQKTEVFFEEQYGCQCMDENNVMLSEVILIPKLKEYFLAKGYATAFAENRYMLSSSVLRKVYQGALGEVAGRFIIENKVLKGMDLTFENLPVEIYEKFDNVIKHKLFFDFKMWSGRHDPRYIDEIKIIRQKMKKTDARKVIIVNILKPKYFPVKPYLDSLPDALLVLPYLYDTEKDEWNDEGLKKLYDVIIDNT